LAIRAGQNVRKGLRVAGRLMDFLDGPSEPLLAPIPKH